MTKIQMRTEREIKPTALEYKKNSVKFFNLSIVIKFLFVLIVICGFYYIAGVNNLSTKGFELKELKQQAKDLENKNKELELKMMALQSLNNLSERVKVLGMVSADRTKYISSEAETVAKK